MLKKKQGHSRHWKGAITLAVGGDGPKGHSVSSKSGVPDVLVVPVPNESVNLTRSRWSFKVLAC